jgi:hypothetical protein
MGLGQKCDRLMEDRKVGLRWGILKKRNNIDFWLWRILLRLGILFGEVVIKFGDRFFKNLKLQRKNSRMQNL